MHLSVFLPNNWFPTVKLPHNEDVKNDKSSAPNIKHGFQSAIVTSLCLHANVICRIEILSKIIFTHGNCISISIFYLKST